MRIAIDATPLLIRSAGVKNYLYHWIDHLRRLAGVAAIRTVPPLAQLGALEHERSVAGPMRTVFGLGSLALSSYTPLPVLDWLTAGADVFHASTLVVHPPRLRRVTATIHDMTAWLMPELHPSANRRAERNFAEVLKRADRLIAVSEHTRGDAVRVLGIDEEKIETIHSGIAEAFFDAHPGDICQRYGLRRPFVLSLGTIEPRKNIDALLDAFGELSADLRGEFELVVAGPLGWAAEKTAARLATVRYLGYIPERDLAPLTAAATVFAYPSLYEGFGFPVAQAMAAAVPVVTSNVSSLPEIAGDAAMLVDPRSVAELRDGLRRMLESPDLRRRFTLLGRARAERFRWSECAAKSLTFFQRVAGR